jgi:hypothetical protein
LIELETVKADIGEVGLRHERMRTAP